MSAPTTAVSKAAVNTMAVLTAVLIGRDVLTGRTVSQPAGEKRTPAYPG